MIFHKIDVTMTILGWIFSVTLITAADRHEDAGPSGDVLSTCMNNGYELFPKRSYTGGQNFLYAFMHLNLISCPFSSENQHARGYFRDFLISFEWKVTTIQNSENYIMSPRKFCNNLNDENEQQICNDALYLFFAYQNWDSALITPEIVLQMNGIDAFKHVYLNYRYSKFKFENLFPGRITHTREGNGEEHNAEEHNAEEQDELTLLEDNNADLTEEEIYGEKNGNIRFKKIQFSYIKAYFNHLLSIAQQMSRLELYKTVADYCLIVARNHLNRKQKKQNMVQNR